MSPQRSPAPPATRRIGLLGGTFDPPHVGHLHAAEAAERAFGLDRVVFVPARRSPHKLERAPAEARHRLAMLELAIAGRPRWSICDLEIARAGPSYTIDTVRALPAAIGEPEDCAIYLVLGSDQLPALPSWREARALLERVEPVVVHRGGDPAAELELAASALGPELGHKLARGYLELPPVRASSTDARALFPILPGRVEALPPAVEAYVRAHGLYGAGAR